MELNIKSSPIALYYLNDYPHTALRFRIEATVGGERTIWKARTTMKKMLETKKYMESQWAH